MEVGDLAQEAVPCITDDFRIVVRENRIITTGVPGLHAGGSEGASAMCLVEREQNCVYRPRICVTHRQVGRRARHVAGHARLREEVGDGCQAHTVKEHATGLAR